MKWREARWAFVILGLLLSVRAPASAQPVPKLTSLSPEWIQRGATGQVVFSGENLATVTGFLFSGAPGLTATNVLPAPPPKSAVTIESDLGGISRAEPSPKRDDKRLVASVTVTSPPRVASLPNASFSVAVKFADSTPAVPELAPDSTM